jgi:hypothetical protein
VYSILLIPSLFICALVYVSSCDLNIA